jgi:hypothetical protein
MTSIASRQKKVVRTKRSRKAKPMAKSEMIKKMLADQKIIKLAIQNGTPLKELEKTHGFKFATLPDPKN